MMKRLTAIALIVAVTLAGCNGLKLPTKGLPNLDTSPDGKTQLDKEIPIQADPRLMVGCAALSDIKANPLPSDVIEQHRADVAQYNDCATRYQILIDAVKKYLKLQ